MVRTILFSDSRELFRHFLEFTPAKRARLPRSCLEKRLQSHLPNLVSASLLWESKAIRNSEICWLNNNRGYLSVTESFWKTPVGRKMEHDFLGRFSGKFPGENKVVRLISQTEIRVPFLQSHLCNPFLCFRPSQPFLSKRNWFVPMVNAIPGRK